METQPEKISPARRIILAPSQPSRWAPGLNHYIRNSLVGKPMTEGDALRISVFGVYFQFTVDDTIPKGLTIVTKDTKLQLNEKPSETQTQVFKSPLDD